jgi:hypothetical protein
MDGSGNDWMIWRDSIVSQKGETSFHYDLLSFLSVALHYKVDLVNTTWQLVFDGGGTCLINQSQVDAEFFLAFKRSKWEFAAEGGSQDLYRNRYRVLITELLALEALRHHPNVVNLVGVTWEIDEDSEVWPVLITQRSGLGNLWGFLQSDEGCKLTTDRKLKLSAEIASSLDEAHSQGKSAIQDPFIFKFSLEKALFIRISSLRMSFSSRRTMGYRQNSSILDMRRLRSFRSKPYKYHLELGRGKLQSMETSHSPFARLPSWTFIRLGCF